MAGGPTRVFIHDRQLTCPFCQHQLFSERPIKLNSTGMSFLGLDWANKSATGLICAQCGHIQMFLDPNIRYAPA